VNLYLSAWSILSKKNQKKFFFIIFLFLLLSLLEIIGIASIIPFITAIFSPEKLSNLPILNNFVDLIEKNQNIILPIFCIIFFSIFLLKNVFSIIIYRYIFGYNSEIRAEVSTRILKKFFNQDYLYFINNSQGKLSATMSSETSVFSTEFLDALMILLSECMLLIAIFILIIFTGHSIIFLAIIPIILTTFLILSFLKKRIKIWGKLRAELAEKMVTVSQRIFIGVRDIYFLKNIDQLINNFYLLNKNQSLLDAKTQTISIIPRALLELMGLTVLLITLIYLYDSGISNNEIISKITFYFVIAYRALPSFSRILVQKQRIKYSENSVKIISETLSLEDKRILKTIDYQNYDFKKSLKLQNIDFAYNNKKNFFTDENFVLECGKVTGIYGQSGSGKSTLLNLITFLFKPDKGKIYIDDNEVLNDMDKRKFQNIVTFLSQDTFLIEDTIKNNITLSSDQNIDNIKLEKAIQLACADKFIKDLPGQLDYMVGTHGRKISSGQKQRIVIARAFYDAREILVLDEATNAIDESTEKEIYQNIIDEKGSKTIVIVSHNKSNLSFCDNKYEIKDGSIIKLIN
jgi:ABC-type bacteriocin/lantibiotic exporter with double-glycine peptidase domain